MCVCVCVCVCVCDNMIQDPSNCMASVQRHFPLRCITLDNNNSLASPLKRGHIPQRFLYTVQYNLDAGVEETLTSYINLVN